MSRRVFGSNGIHRQYKDLGTRMCACGCGDSFVVTTKNPKQQCVNRDHAADLKSRQMTNGHRPNARVRDALEMLLDGELGADTRLTRSRLLGVLEKVELRGYNRGWAARARGGLSPRKEHAA